MFLWLNTCFRIDTPLLRWHETRRIKDMNDPFYQLGVEKDGKCVSTFDAEREKQLKEYSEVGAIFLNFNHKMDLACWVSTKY